MKHFCPTCGGRVKLAGTTGALIPQEAMRLLEEICEISPLRMSRIMEIILTLPREEVEKLIRETEDYLGR